MIFNWYSMWNFGTRSTEIHGPINGTQGCWRQTDRNERSFEGLVSARTAFPIGFEWLNSQVDLLWVEDIWRYWCHGKNQFSWTRHHTTHSWKSDRGSPISRFCEMVKATFGARCSKNWDWLMSSMGLWNEPPTIPQWTNTGIYWDYWGFISELGFIIGIIN